MTATRATRRTFSGSALAAAKPPTATVKVDFWGEFCAKHPEEAAWIEARQHDFEFAANMRSAIHRFGSLLGTQLDGIRKCMAANKAAAARPAGPEVNVGKIEEAFSSAMGDGIARPKLRLDAFLFKPAPSSGKNAGAIYVMEEETYLGKIIAGRFTKSRDCSDDQQARIIASAADPEKAAIAYGLRTGRCSVCNQELTNEDSLSIGIGPICRERMGW
jgi:Family of unknown function (DUF6011)